MRQVDDRGDRVGAKGNAASPGQVQAAPNQPSMARGSGMKRPFLAWLGLASLRGQTSVAWPASAASRLAWGPLLQAASPHPLPPIVEEAIAAGGAALGQEILPASQLRLAGTLNSDPAHRAAGRVKATFPTLLNLALAARLGPDDVRGPAFAKVSRILLAWSGAYRPSGNPIDERFFLLLFLAADLVLPVMPGTARLVLRSWLRDFVAAGDRFYARRPANDLARQNNWMAARLLVRALAGTIAGNDTTQMQTRRLLFTFGQVNFERDADGRLDGRTFDFRQRDALTYHVVDLDFLLKILSFVPGVVDAELRAHIRRGLLFCKPYVLGEKEHIEFLRTTVSFDVKRREQDPSNTDFQNRPWQPARAWPLLRLAALSFPEITSWTGPVRADAGTELLVALISKQAALDQRR
ncbi:hypothetical protein [Neoroseomonas lacus]|uniref:hypothetical protein n=1 Tax=Neoroseomonas lacus TaxID=287609 RepID=UPI001666986C|nr:hypothetical protein [Neoroseomonas lacus]